MRPKSLITHSVLNELAETARQVPPGDFVEVGVYQGGSAWVLGGVAREQGRKLWLFDTFSGMPYADLSIDHHRKGEFGDTSEEKVREAIPDAILVPGVFPKTLKDAIGLGLESIALAHIDCDQYKSVRACCSQLGPLMMPGGVMIIDDYDALEGARKAVAEVFNGRVEISPQGKARVRF